MLPSHASRQKPSDAISNFKRVSGTLDCSKIGQRPPPPGEFECYFTNIEDYGSLELRIILEEVRETQLNHFLDSESDAVKPFILQEIPG